jgi:hypothetical protein
VTITRNDYDARRQGQVIARIEKAARLATGGLKLMRFRYFEAFAPWVPAPFSRPCSTKTLKLIMQGLGIGRC